MNCVEFERHLHAYVDGELAVSEMLAADAHLAECAECRALAARERRFRQLLRRQPRESAPAEFRAQITRRICRAEQRAVVRPWLIAAPIAAVAAVFALVLWPTTQPSSRLVSELVDKHIAYAQIEQPAEFGSTDPAAVEQWFRTRAALRVTVSDYSPSGIRLVGARLADAAEQKAAYVLYEKGHTLLSVFMLPVSGHGADLRGKHVSYRGQEYVTLERKGYRTVSWVDGHTLLGLVSMLDYAALFECADRLRADRAHNAQL
jgi:anti-sigma factor (TIGR02949 family)